MSFARFVGVAYQGEKFCRELARQILAAHGIPMPLVDQPGDAGGWARVTLPAALDVVVFNRAGRPAHVGVCIDSGRFLHVEEGRRSQIDRLSAPHWAARIEGIYRYQGSRA